MFIYSPGEHQLGELDFAFVRDNVLHIRTKGGQEFTELFTDERAAAGELLNINRALENGAITYTLEIDYTPRITP